MVFSLERLPVTTVLGSLVRPGIDFLVLILTTLVARGDHLHAAVALAGYVGAARGSRTFINFKPTFADVV